MLFKKILIVFAIFLVFNKKSFSQIINENVSIINICSGGNFDFQNQNINLVYAPIGFSVDYFSILKGDTLLCFDENKGILYLVNLKTNLLIDKLDLFAQKNISIFKNEKKLGYCEFLGPDINPFTYFSLYNALGRIEFEKFDDNKVKFALLKTSRTNKTATEIFVKINNKKLSLELFEYKQKFFDELNKENAFYFNQNFEYNSVPFYFNKKEYYFIKTSPYRYDRCANYKYDFNLFYELNSSNSLSLIKKQSINYNPNNKNIDTRNRVNSAYSDVNNDYMFLSHDNKLIQYTQNSESLILRDSALNITNKYNLDSLLFNKSRTKIYIYKDNATNKIFLINEINAYKKDSLSQMKLIYDLYELNFKGNSLKILKTKTIISNKSIKVGQLENDNLYFTCKNPLFNTDFLFNLKVEKYSKYDTINLTFERYNSINLFAYQDLINNQYFSGLKYDKMPKEIIKTIFDDRRKKSFPQNSLRDVLESVQSCLKNNLRKDLISKLLVFENLEIQTLDFLHENNILDPKLINNLFFEILDKDITDILKNDKIPSFEFINNINIIKTKSNHFLKLIKLEDKYYLSANIGYETNTAIINKDRTFFKKKYKYLKYNYENTYSNLKIDVRNSVFDTVQNLVLLYKMEDSNNDILIHDKANSNNTTENLFKSALNAIKNDEISYAKKFLTIYNAASIPAVENDIKNVNIIDTINKKNSIYLLNKLLNKEYDVVKISKNIKSYRVKTSNNSYCDFYVIYFSKHYFFYNMVENNQSIK